MDKRRMIAIGKPQFVRLIDVFFLGPLMVYIGLQGRFKIPSLLRVVMLTSGAMTVIYNGRNYLIQRRILKELKEVSPEDASRTIHARFEE